MIFDGSLTFHSGTTAWAITADEWSPYLLDLGAAKAALNITGDAYIWIQVAVAGTFAGGDEYHTFKLASSDTYTGTIGNGGYLNGTVSYVTLFGKTAENVAPLTTVGEFIYRGAIPMEVKGRYIQLYDDTDGTSTVLSVYAGLCNANALPSTWSPLRQPLSEPSLLAGE